MTATAKKMLSVFLAFVLVFTLSPTVAFGGNDGVGASTDAEQGSEDEGGNTGDANGLVVNDRPLESTAPAGDGTPAANATANTPGEEDGDGEPQDGEGSTDDEEPQEGDDPADEEGPETDEREELTSASDPDGEITAQNAQTYNLTDDGKNYLTYDNYSSETTGNGYAILGYHVEGSDLEIAIPETIDSTPVVALGTPDQALSGYKTGSIKSITIPKSVNYVSGFKFHNTNAESIVFESGSTIATLYPDMFADYKTDGVSITLPDALQAIPARLFKNGYITSITLPGAVTAIDMNAFTDDGRLASVNLNEGLLTIGQEAFAPTHNGGAISNYPLFASIEIPSSVTTIEKEAFFKNIKLASLNFASGSALATIGDYAFYGTNLTSVNIPSSVTSIGTGAFSGKNYQNDIDGDENPGSNGAYTLTSVTFGSGSQLTTLGARAFARQPIAQVELPSGLTSLGYDKSTYKFDDKGSMFFFGGRSDHTASVKMGAFAGCAQLTSITWPQGGGFTTVGGFNDCTSLPGTVVNNLPSSVTRIDDYAFYNCTAMDDVLIPKTVTTIGKGAFSQPTNGESKNKTFTLLNKDTVLEGWSTDDPKTCPWPLGCGYTINYPRSAGDDTAYDIIKYRNAVQTYEAAKGYSDENKTKFVPVADETYQVKGIVPAGASVRLYVDGTMKEPELEADNSFTAHIGAGSLVGAVVSLEGYQDYIVSPEEGKNVAELKTDWTFDATGEMVALSDLGVLEVTATGPYRANCNIAVFDSDGKLVSQGGALRCSQGDADEAPVYIVDGIPKGTYTVVGWQENDYFSRISSIGDFAAMGFSAGDYATALATVAAGGTATVNLAIPKLDTSKISAVLATGDVTIASYYNPIKVPFTATVNYDMTTGQKVESVQVSIPDGLEPLAAATTAKRYYSNADSINTGSWDATNHVLTISDLDAADTQSGKIALSLKATTAGSYVVSASLVSGSTIAPLGGADVECPAIRLVVPEGTLSSKTFTVHVYAEPNSDVELKIGDTVLDTACKTNLVGHAKVSATIPDKELSFSSYYQVTATLKDSSEDPKPSDTALVEYNAYLDDIPLEPTVYDFWFESAGQKVVLSEAGEERSGGFYTVATAQHRTIFSTAWPFTASIDSLQPSKRRRRCTWACSTTPCAASP